MIAVDSNLLVYAHRRDSSWHEQARDRVTELAQDRRVWAIPWPCLHQTRDKLGSDSEPSLTLLRLRSDLAS